MSRTVDTRIDSAIIMGIGRITGSPSHVVLGRNPWTNFTRDSIEICILVNFDFTLIYFINRESSLGFWIAHHKREREVREEMCIVLSCKFLFILVNSCSYEWGHSMTLRRNPLNLMCLYFFMVINFSL